MRSVVDVVDQLLTAGVNVTVYNGQLDLIVDTMGNVLHVFPPVKPGQQRCKLPQIPTLDPSGKESQATWSLLPVTQVYFLSQVRSCG